MQGNPLNRAEAAATQLFQLEFQQDTFLFLGVIYFALLIYWIFTLEKSLRARFHAGGSERLWLYFSVVIGLAFGVVTSLEWGLPLLGTAFSLGFCISLAFIHPHAATCLLASSLFLRPWELVGEDTFLSILPRLSIILCLSHLTLTFTEKRRAAFRWSRTANFVLLFTGWSFITTLFAPDPSSSQSDFFDVLLKSITLFFILLQMIRAQESLRLLLGTLLISFLSVTSISIYQSLRLGSIMEFPFFRLVGFGSFANSNDTASLMVWILPFAVFLAIRKNENLFYRILGFALASSGLIAIILSRSRGAMLGVAAMLALYFLLRLGRKALVPLTIGAILLAIPSAIFIFNRQSADLEASSAGRKTYLKAGLRMGVKNPVFGVGFNAYPMSLATYSTESLEESAKMTAHNSWILVFAELGIIGLLLFTGIYFYCGFSAWKIYSTSPEFLLSLVGYGVTIFFLSHSYLIYPYLLFAWVEAASEGAFS